MATREELENIIATAKTPEVRQLAEAQLQKLDFIDAAAQGDELAKLLLILKDSVDLWKSNNPQAVAGAISKDEVEKLLEEALKKTKISYEDLNAELKAKLSGQVKVQLSLNTPYAKGIQTSKTMLTEFEKPLFQKVLSDFLARNNVYLYGGAGTGKTYLAAQIAKFLNYRYIEVNCNQFTSPLNLIGGQTITGYQKGSLEMAWTNVDERGEKFEGAVLCLDELPKLDPNTAGLLNAALAKIKDFTEDAAGNIVGPKIRNGRGEEIELKNMFVIATGNVRLNETSVEYEANFKQDLSLQDRFAGSCYEVFPAYKTEFNDVMKGMAFIWIYMQKVRQVIIDNRLTGQAFVSFRILISMRDTYRVYRESQGLKVAEESLIEPKTLKQALDSFLNLFKPNQVDLIKQQTNYDEFIRLIEQKNKLPLDKLDTPQELQEGSEMVARLEQQVKNKTA
jgi:cobaltochelatase CobS